MTAIGIDLGTTNSLVAVFEDGAPRLIPNKYGDLLTPSVVSFHDGALDVGKAARARLVTHPNDTAALFKRNMGTETEVRLGRKSYRAEELSAMVLQSLKADAEADLGRIVTDVVVSVPAYFNELQRKAVKSACRMADLNPVRLINEPTAAALAYGIHERDAEKTFLVYDLGGGTFDVSLMEFFEGVMEVKATAGDAFIGGEDFTKDLARHLARKLPDRPLDDADRAALLTVADQAKTGLSTAHEVQVDTMIGPDALTLTLTRAEFEEINADNLKRLHRPVDRALYDAGLTADDLDGVVLVGGATRMPVIRSQIAKHLRQLPDSRIDPDHVVALGAAVQAALVERDEALDDVVMTDVSAFTLGVDTAREVGGRMEAGFFSPIIERNSVIPISREDHFSTAVKGQREITFGIYQGESPFVKSNIKLGEVKIRVPRNTDAHEGVTVRFSYDVSGLLEVDCTALSSGETTSITITSLAGELSDKDIARRSEALKALKVHPRDQAETKLILARLERCYAMARERDRQYLADLLVEFQNEVEGQDLSRISDLTARISETLDEFEHGYAR